MRATPKIKTTGYKTEGESKPSPNAAQQGREGRESAPTSYQEMVKFWQLENIAVTAQKLIEERELVKQQRARIEAETQKVEAETQVALAQAEAYMLQNEKTRAELGKEAAKKEYTKQEE